MNYILKLLVLSCLCNNLYSQEHEQLLLILKSNIEVVEKQRKIDLFIASIQDKASPPTLANCYHDLGSKWYYPNSNLTPGDRNLEKAIFYTMKSLEIKRTLTDIEDCSLNKTVYNLGYFNLRNNNIYDAIELYKELDQYGYQYCTDRENNKDKVRWALMDLGRIYKILGNYYEAFEVCDRMLKIYEFHEYPEKIGQMTAAEAHLQKAEIYFRIDPSQYENQIYDHLNQAESFNKITNADYHINWARILNLKANCLTETADYEGALITYPLELDYFSENDSLNKAVVYNNMGYCLNKLERFIEAENQLKKAIELNPRDGDPYNNLGDLLLAKKKFNMAMENYNKAIVLEIDSDLEIPSIELPGIDQLEIAVDKTSLLNHLVTKANAWLTWYEHEPNPEHLEHALETFDLADQLVDLIRFESTEQQSKLYWREKGASLYLKAVEVCYLLNRPERAFYFMERNKALLLLEDLGHEEAKRIAGLPVAAAQREFKLRRQIFLAENEVHDTNTDTQQDSLRYAVRLAKNNYGDYIDSLNLAYPDYARYKRKVAIIAFDEFKDNYLSAKRDVLHYILNEEGGYGLLNTSNSSMLFRLEGIEQLNEQIGNYMRLLSSGISDMNLFTELSHSLFKQLIPSEVQAQLQGKQLLIVPDYNLQRIPFETLVTNAKDQRYLIEDTEIAYTYSLSLLERQAGINRQIDKSVVAMAPVIFQTPNLSNLPFSEEEAITVSDLFEGEHFLNEEASKIRFMETASGHQIIHLATHAGLGEGENPWIAFSDGKMSLKEIYATPTQSEMVVLSACNTSQGDLKPGEGVMSLARGFFYSGAKCVVSSLWPITDRGGRDIMKSFYQSLISGDTKSAAMRRAKLDYLQEAKIPELKHPYYWAGFVVLGDNAPLVEGSSLNWMLIALVVIVGLLFFGRRLLKFGQ